MLGRQAIVPILIVLTIVAFMLPREWTGGLMSLMQVLVPFQHAATGAVEMIDDTEAHEEPVSGATYRSLSIEKAALEHQVASLVSRVTELESEVELLQGTRLWDAQGGRLGARGLLIPARVVTDDLLSWRASRLINVGTLQGVERGSVVTSHYFSIDRGEAGGVRSGLAILLKEVFIGIVEQAGTHTARVKLLSDPSVEMKVRIGRLRDEGFVPLDRYFWLKGRGRGVMEIRDVHRRDTRPAVDTTGNEVGPPMIQVGDVVLSDPMSDLLPASMTVGRIARIEADLKNPLLCILQVESAMDVASLRRVYVYDPDTTVDDDSTIEP